MYRGKDIGGREELIKTCLSILVEGTQILNLILDSMLSSGFDAIKCMCLC